MAADDLHPETIAISSGRPPHVAGEGINLPISLNSTLSQMVLLVTADLETKPGIHLKMPLAH